MFDAMQTQTKGGRGGMEVFVETVGTKTLTKLTDCDCINKLWTNVWKEGKEVGIYCLKNTSISVLGVLWSDQSKVSLII